MVYGQKSLLGRTMHDIRYDPVNDEVLVPNPFASAILVFRGSANGQEGPVRVIQGPRTELGNPDRADVDPVHNEIFVPEDGKILVYSRTANGDAAPIRSIRGPDTMLDSLQGMAVDPVHNMLAVARNDEDSQGRPSGAVLIFNRTDSGNVKPRGVIQGPKSGLGRLNQVQIYAPKGWIVLTESGPPSEEEPEGVYIGIWHIGNNGDIPPRWKLTGPKTLMKKPRGVALIPQYKELIVADMRLNSVLTYSFPEMF